MDGYVFLSRPEMGKVPANPFGPVAGLGYPEAMGSSRTGFVADLE
jgi:hypothetical protein